jgi:hypothetical protein
MSTSINPIKFALTIACALLSAFVAQASEYPVRDNTEILMLDDPRVNFELRIILTRKEKHAIDGMAFTQLNDELGRPLLEAIHYAQVTHHTPVRMAYDILASAIEGKGRGIPAAGWIADENLVCKGEVVCAHPIEKLSAGISQSDYVHLKSYRVGEVTFIGGYNNTGHSLRTLDSGFIIRAIDPTKPFLGTDIAKNYDEVFGILNKMKEDSIIPIPNRKIESPLTGEELSLIYTEEQKAKVQEVLNILSKPAQTDDILLDYQFRPKKVQLRTNDLFKNLTKSRAERRALGGRYGFPNSNHSHLAQEIHNFQTLSEANIHYWGYVYAPTPEVHLAIIDYVNAGGTFTIWTNGKNAHKTVTWRGISVYYSLENIDDLLTKTEHGKGKVVVKLLDAEKAKIAGMGPYVHRKRIAFTSLERNMVLDSSDNFTWSSAMKNDELSISIEDDRYVGKAMKISKAEAHTYDTVSTKTIHEMYEGRPKLAYSCVKLLLKKVF